MNSFIVYKYTFPNGRSQIYINHTWTMKNKQKKQNAGNEITTRTVVLVKSCVDESDFTP